MKGEAVGKEDGSGMGSDDDDDARVGSWAGQYGTSARSGASACVSLRTNESNESNENMKTEASTRG